MYKPLNLGVPVLCRHVRLINVKPITAQEKFNFPRANANPSPRTGIALGTRLPLLLNSVFIKLQYKVKNNKADNNLTK